MPPKKRKSIPADSDSEDNYVDRAKVARRKASSKKSAPKPVETSSYIAKLVTAGYDVPQNYVCQYYSPADFPDFSERCTSCIEKQAIRGTCRFVNLRSFKRVDGIVDYGDYAFRSNTTPPAPKASEKKKAPKKIKKKAPPMVTRGTRSRPAPTTVVVDVDADEALAPSDEPGETSIGTGPTGAGLTPAERQLEANYVLPLIAPTFAGQLRREQRHESAHLDSSAANELPGSPRPLIRVFALPGIRSLCDACSTSIYMGSYLCGCCGAELCLGCWEGWEPSTDRNDRNFFYTRDGCSRRRRHVRDSMVFVSRASDGEISKLLERVERHIPSVEKQEQENIDAVVDADSIPTSQASWPNDKGPKYLATPKTHRSELTLRQFQALWRRGGVPLVLTGFTDRFKLPWDPQYFILNHGQENCLIHDCIDGRVVETTVAKFFRKFDDPTCIDSHKLKDWPPSADFSITFPKLFRDFESALPFRSYTARKGTLNLAAHFPEGSNAPDLGPKMYNAYPAPDFLPESEDENAQPHSVKGTTNLHLDLTDAMNIMLFSAGGTLAPAASTSTKGIPPCGAIWDIFPPSASSGIRSYLNSPAYIDSHPGAAVQDDPIHRQCYYLTEADLTTLSAEYGVRSHRIFQEPGEAVFVPAGCCHQVRNRKSCVKVAVDFLTPENVKVCRGLIEEARGMAGEFGRSRDGKEDVLQLWACLGFAWKFYDVEPKSEGEGEGESDKVADGEQKASSGEDAAMAEPELKTDPAQDKLENGIRAEATGKPTRTEIVVAEPEAETTETADTKPVAEVEV